MLLELLWNVTITWSTGVLYIYEKCRGGNIMYESARNRAEIDFHIAKHRDKREKCITTWKNRCWEMVETKFLADILTIFSSEVPFSRIGKLQVSQTNAGIDEEF
ncbi:hypothetical protein WN51_14514 [Melipona quadrifasciata]|uniref:Uncharacterized protein n=1 Tax=Melipona quadrifasciata TaxID=166423 RepID=A0A0N0BFK2_9HYME|nr:hypothetical protein WN51_14514 [Melipona quadrifasciata]